jgi:hypothetical protein
MISSASPVSLVDASGEELRTLLSPISPEIFVREYWAKKPLFVKGFEAKFKGFFDGETFSRAVTRSCAGGFPARELRPENGVG